MTTDSSTPSANQAILRLFNSVAEPGSDANIPEGKNEILQRLLSKYQVVVSKSALYAIDDIQKHVEKTQLSPEQLNSTFYRSWEDVVSRSPMELLIDQMLHYMTTFGTNFEGPVYIPADQIPLNIEAPKEGWKVTMIDTIDHADLERKCKSLLCSGTALSTTVICDVMIVLDWLKAEISLQEIRNRDTKTLLISNRIEAKLPVVECEPQELLKAIVYRCTDTLVVVKDKETLLAIKSRKPNIAHTFTIYGLERLATIFNRFKPLFLALKSLKDNIKTINDISKLSKTNHKPLAQNPMSMVTFRQIDTAKEMHWVMNATVPAKLRALDICRQSMVDRHGSLYRIRNGKLWAEERERGPTAAACANFKVILGDLRRILSPRFQGKKIYIPEGIEYGLPVSDLQMLGSIPYGTVFTFPNSVPVAIGAYWNRGYGVSLLDLSGRTNTKEYISWCTKYKSGSFVYSGDMTCPVEHGAAEYILTKPGSECESIELRASCWSGTQKDWNFDIIIGTGDDINKEYMMNPENLLASFKYHANKATCDIGYLERDDQQTRFILMPGSVSNRITNAGTDSKVSDMSKESISHKLRNSMKLNEVLELLGAEVVRTKEDGEVIDIDLGLDQISKDFLNLMVE